MSKLMYKHGNLDKYDGYMPNKAHWVHDQYDASPWQEYFHTPVAWGYQPGHRRSGFGFGIQKKMWKVSSKGIMVDSYHVGKSDLS